MLGLVGYSLAPEAGGVAAMNAGEIWHLMIEEPSQWCTVLIILIFMIILHNTMNASRKEKNDNAMSRGIL